MRVRVVDDSVHVGVGTDQGRVDCRDDGLAVGAGTPPPPRPACNSVGGKERAGTFQGAIMSPRCDGGVHRLETRRQQGARIRHVLSQSGPKRVTVWLWLVVAGRCWLQLVAACPKRVTVWLWLAAAGHCWPQLVAAGLP